MLVLPTDRMISAKNNIIVQISLLLLIVAFELDLNLSVLSLGTTVVIPKPAHSACKG